MIYFEIFIVLYLLVLLYNHEKPLAPGVGYAGKVHTVPEKNVSFFFDRTFVDNKGNQESEQEIFDEVFRMIREAQRFIVIDMFLFNNFGQENKKVYRSLSAELSQLLIEKRANNSDISITVITDVINTVYGGSTPKMFKDMEASGIRVVFVNLSKLRDPNPLYSTLWRILFQWFGNSEKFGLLPHPFTKDLRVTLRSYLRLLNMKANHRKLIIADTNAEVSVLVLSGNPHDGSSANTNTAIKVTGGELWCDVLESEELVASFSDSCKIPCHHNKGQQPTNFSTPTLSVQALTEGKISKAFLEEISALKKGDSVDIVMFYLSHKKAIRALVEAASRGVAIRIILDPAKNAFGYEKSGVPNRSVATNELVGRSKGTIQVRWYSTHGEQCHSKFIQMKKGSEDIIFSGSMNLTRRSADNYNLEVDVLVRGRNEAVVFTRANSWFEDLWGNTEGREFTLPFEHYRDTSLLHQIQYKMMEKTGLGTF